MKNKTTKETKSTAKKSTKATKAKAKPQNVKPASWLVGRLRNALHKTKPTLKDEKTLKQVSTLSDIKAALQMVPSEWENLLETFFNLGGKLA